MTKPKELAILFKKIIHPNDEIEYIPIKTIEGIYNEKNKSFIDKDGTPYFHIIENPDSYGYCYRDSIANYKLNYKHLSVSLIKTLILRTIKKYTYTYNIDEETEAPIILFTSKKKPSEINILLDEEITNYYIEKFPEYYNKYLNQNIEETEEPEQQQELDIQNIYKQMISIIIDQDEAIQKIISTIWQQNLGITKLHKNIIIEGPSGVGKSKICKLLIELLNIPSATISTSEGKMKCVDYLILELVKHAGGDIAKAQKGIIVLDKFEDFLMYSSPEGRGELEKILEENKLIISSNVGEFIFDTSQLIVIGICDFQKIKPDKKLITGFERENNNKINNSILEMFSEPIKLNRLDYDSYIKILNSSQGLLNQNIELLNKQGVNLVISESVKDKIAQLSSTSKYRVKDLEKIIHRTLQIAEFEIASNPNLYSELIITEETIKNNRAYTLIRK